MNNPPKVKKQRSRILRLLITVDAFFNVLILNGSEDHTISGRVGYMSLTTDKKRWKYAEKFIDALFFFDPNHCYNSIEYDEI